MATGRRTSTVSMEVELVEGAVSDGSSELGLPQNSPVSRASSEAIDHEAAASDIEMEDLIDTDLFCEQGDIRFQLPSKLPDATLSRTIKRRKTLAPTAATLKRNASSSRYRREIRKKQSLKSSKINHASMKVGSRSRPAMRDEATNEDGLGGSGYRTEDEYDGMLDYLELPSAETLRVEVEHVRNLPISLKQKKVVRNRIQNQPSEKLQGIEKTKFRALKWKRSLQLRLGGLFGFEVWRKTLKEIEGRFGAGIMSYFRLVKWMFFLNIFLTACTLPIILPQLILLPQTFSETVGNFSLLTTNNSTGSIPGVTDQGTGQEEIIPSALVYNLSPYLQKARECSSNYSNALAEQLRDRTPFAYILDFVQGTGYFSDTILFYGHYFNKTYELRWWSEADKKDQVPAAYNLGVAYLLCTAIFFLGSLGFIVPSTTSGLRQALISEERVAYKLINKVFAGWDCGMTDLRGARIRKALIKQDLLSELAEIKRVELAKNRPASWKFRVYLTRLAVHTLCFVILGLCGVAIYFIQVLSSTELEKGNNHVLMELILQYMPSVTITVMYALFPTLFGKLADWEQYSPPMRLNVTLIRIVLLRLAIVILLLAPIYVRLIGCAPEDRKCGSCYSDPLRICWETYIGQQVYRLVLLDFFVFVGMVTCFEFPRKWLWDRYKQQKLVEFVGQEEFDIPVNVMDVTYTQTLCWLGAFYSPLLPLITLFKIFVMFHLRKLSLMKNQCPSSIPYRASNVHLFFMIVLTSAFVLAVLTIGFAVAIISPSQGCGPFRVYTTSDHYTMFTAIRDALDITSSGIKDFVNFITSPVFQFPLFLLLCILIYYYTAVGHAQSQLMEILKKHLVSEQKGKEARLAQCNMALANKLLPTDSIE